MIKKKLGVEPGMPVETNAAGGKQSTSPNGFHLQPPYAMFAAARVAKEGADKYDETRLERNYKKIPCDSHLNHALQHIFAFLAGDESDSHLSHALVRLMFAYECDYESRECDDKQ